jgi:hypothetical protein
MEDNTRLAALLITLFDDLAHDDLRRLAEVVACVSVGLLGGGDGGALLAIALHRVRWAVNKGALRRTRAHCARAARVRRRFTA